VYIVIIEYYKYNYKSNIETGLLMTQRNIHKILKADYLMLLPIMALAFYLAFIPHHVYPYPVHLDEWIHLACSNQIISQGTTVGLVDPFSGGPASLNQLFEFGFHLFWAVFHQISGVSWLTIIRYFPAVIFLVTVLSVYVLAKRQGFGWEAAFFTTLITTTAGILGPGFLVPVAMGLLFIALSIFIALNFRGWCAYVILAIFVFFLATMHIVTSCILIIILAPYIFINLKGNFRHSLGITLALSAPLIVALALFDPMFQSYILKTWESLFTPTLPLTFVQLPQIIPAYGYLPIIFCLVGTGILALRGGKRNYGLAMGLLALLVVLATFFALHYGEKWIYYRGLMYSMLLMSIVAGAGLNLVRSIRLSAKFLGRFKNSLVIRNTGNILCIILIGVTLVIAIPNRQDTSYYHMIDDSDYEAFVWIKENVGGEYERAVLDPWKGTAFTAITGKYVYTMIGEYPTPRAEQAYEFLLDGSSDTSFLRGNGISIIYTQQQVHNPELVEVRKNIYLLKEAAEPE